MIGDTCVKNDKGCLVFTDTEKLKAWEEHDEKLLNKEFPWDSNLLQMESPKEGPAPWLEKDAIYTALNKMKDGKAAGVSGIVSEMLKASGEAGLELFIELFNNIVKEEKVPSVKGERGNFRGLELLDHLMKLFERVIEKYIRHAVWVHAWKRNDGCNIYHSYNAENVPCKTFVDLEKAFDRVP